MMRSVDFRARGATRGRIAALAVCSVLGLATPASAESLERLVSAHREKPSERTRAPLESFAARHPRDTEGAVALLYLGAAESESGGFESAIPKLQAARDRLPPLADYASFHLARVFLQQERYGQAILAAEEVLQHQPSSPWRGDAVLLAAQAHLEGGRAQLGERLLRANLPELPQPAAFALLARIHEAVGNDIGAASSWQRIYYEFPLTGEARDAGTALEKLRRSLGRGYPPVAASLMFFRVDRLLRASQHEAARKELQFMTAALAGADRDRARVWLGKARHLRQHDREAYHWLQGLSVKDPEADAERLYYLLAAARRLGRDAEVLGIAAQISRKYPDSDWRLEALVSAGNLFLLVNDHDRYNPLYQSCADHFPGHQDAAYCDWKVAWSYYVRRLPDAADRLQSHLGKHPGSDKAPAALYFLGRLAEDAEDRPAALTYYRELEREYPHWYYAFRARERLMALGGNGAESAAVREFLAAIEFPERRHQKDFEVDRATQARLDRARPLLAAGLREWAERELRHGARTGAQGPVLAMELARLSAAAGDYGRSIRSIKGLAPGYLFVPIEDAPAEFWKLAFPLAYRDALEKYSRQRRLDLYLLAALIRQESEFDPRAVSRASAYGLTQVLPSTGRLLAPKLGIRRFRTSLLYSPEVNVNMGTYYLREMIDSLGGHVEAALAAYNAGKSRAERWLTWGEFREPSEFMETIPFSETRTYVETVLRNADLYRRLYAR